MKRNLLARRKRLLRESRLMRRSRSMRRPHLLREAVAGPSWAIESIADMLYDNQDRIPADADADDIKALVDQLIEEALMSQEINSAEYSALQNTAENMYNQCDLDPSCLEDLFDMNSDTGIMVTDDDIAADLELELIDPRPDLEEETFDDEW